MSRHPLWKRFVTLLEEPEDPSLQLAQAGLNVPEVFLAKGTPVCLPFMPAEATIGPMLPVELAERFQAETPMRARLQKD
jgi:hypothetical protein